MFSDCVSMFIMALTTWREARGEGRQGMAAVCWVIKNRANRYKISEYAVCVKRWAFSSINSADDPQLSNWPSETDATFTSAEAIVVAVVNDETPDPTGGATLYYDDSISLPASWDKSKVQATVKIGRLNFFKEL